MDHLKGTKEIATPNILIVDDDPDTCKLLETLFRVEGYTTKVVYTGQDGVNYVETNNPDVVVLDVMMPVMDGWETFSKIHSHSNVPVLFLTALPSKETISHALSLGVKDYLLKPFSYQELLSRVNALLTNARSIKAKLNLAADPDTLIRDAGITVVIPAYNEARFIGSTVLKARNYASQVIVVDDGSSDNTAEIAKSAGAILVQHPCNKGKGVALNTGFCKAREMGSQLVVTLDADGQHLPEELSKVVMPVLTGEADIVIGSRYLKEHYEVPRARIWGHWFFNQLTRMASGTASTDSQSGYRAFSPAAIEVISFCSKGFTVESEMQFIAHENGLRLKEVPITILYTDKPKRSVISQGLSVLGGVFKLTGQYRPLLYFGLPGFLSMLTGLAWGLAVIDRYQEVHELATGYALISTMLIIIGLVLFTTGFMLHSIRGLLSDMLHSKKNS